MRKIKILVVDDDELFAKSLSQLLELYDYSCTVALSGNQSILLLESDVFDLILLDIQLNDVHGFDILDYLHQSGVSAPTIMLTGMGTVELAVESMKKGAYDYLRKPVDHGQLLKTLDKAIQHHRLKKELKASEQRFRALAHASWEAIVIHKDGKLLDANEQFYAMFGYTASDQVHTNFFDMIIAAPQDPIVDQEGLGMNPVSIEILGKTKNGTTFPMEIRCRTIRYQDNHARVCAIRDISERVKAEEERLKAQAKSAQTDKLNALGLLAGSVAHDLNNILTGIVSYPDLLLANMDPKDSLAGPIERIRESGLRASGVIADLLTLAREGNEKPTVQDLHQLISKFLGSIELTRMLEQATHTRIVSRLNAPKSLICATPTALDKLLLNLIVNSMDAMEGVGRIQIITENCNSLPSSLAHNGLDLAPSYIKLTVSDEGPGIEEKHIKNIFDPFYSTKVMKKSGTGLGLTVVWRTIQSLHGFIEVTNTSPGVRFEIYLPAVLETSQSCPLNVLNEKAQLPIGKGEDILLVDDEVEQNMIIGGLLQKLGYTSHSVTSGEACLEFLFRSTVDLIVLDMQLGMERMNGLQTYEKILAIKPNQRVIVLSGFAEPGEMDKIEDLGVNAFLTKPVTFRMLAETVSRVLTN